MSRSNSLDIGTWTLSADSAVLRFPAGRFWLRLQTAFRFTNCVFFFSPPEAFACLDVKFTIVQ